jgi:hypothetical protein
MGAKLGEGFSERSKRPLDAWDRWFVMLSSMAINEPIGKPFFQLSQEGWVIDPITFNELRSFVAPTIIPLEPNPSKGFIFPSAGDRARRQLAQWEAVHKEEVLYLVVPDPNKEEDRLWLTQPVPRSLITEHTSEWVLEQYQNSLPEQPEHAMFRAAFIARTGTQPERMMSIHPPWVVTEG